MMKSDNSVNRWVEKIISLCLIVGLFLPAFTQVLAATEATTLITNELRLIPTSLTVTPATATEVECGNPLTCVKVQFTAIAHYNYPDAPAIPDRDVTADSLTTWSSSSPEVALINTIGLATPVSDLNMGNMSVMITALYGGVLAAVPFKVIGAFQPPDTTGGGGGGEPSPPPPPDVPPPPPDVPPVPPSEPPVSPTPSTPPSGIPAPPSGSSGYGIVDKVTRVDSSSGSSAYLPLVEPVPPDQIKPVDRVLNANPVRGLTRAIAVSRIAENMNIFAKRKNFYARCFANLENCTNIFRMYSSYKGINLDPNNLRLFPDLDGSVFRTDVEKMALSGSISGYYALKDSPFLPDKAISNVEMVKVVVAVVNTLEKSTAGYVAPKFDFNTLFYKDVYVASLLSALNEPIVKKSKVKVSSGIPLALASFVKVAHAISDQGLILLRSQSVPFDDVRPDLYDNQWYYPIVYNKACALGVIDCKSGGLARPDENPTLAELDSLLDKVNAYLAEKNISEATVEEDSDHDGLTNLEENSIYLTDPNKADTDGDGLSDGDEILKYKTDPNKADTDGDGLSDGDEVLKYKTNPNKTDTDGDGFSDGLEIAAGSNSLNPLSTPDDKNNNRISDKWEVKYGIQVKNGSQDTDGDGLSDALEFQYGSDPIKIDTDGDGYTDAEEVLTLHSDPLDPKSPGKIEDLKVLINNFQYGQLVADPSPMIKGVGPASLGNSQVKIQVLLRNDFGSEMMLGDTQTDAKGNFIFFPSIALKNGTYYLLARSLSGADVQLSEPIKIIIDTSLDVAIARPEKIEQTLVTAEDLSKDLVLKVDTTDNRPVLYGTLSEFGSKVNVTWQSLVVSSALVADATDGSFSVKAPVLAEGRHVVYIQTVRSRDNAMSKTLKINFDLKKIILEKNVAEKLAGAELAKGVDVVAFVAKQSWPFWVVLVVVLILVIGGGYFFILWKNDDKEEKKNTKT